MNLNEIKKILKPLIKETVKEVLYEGGLLSGIVAEVAKGLQGQVITETKQPVAKQPLSSGPTPDEVKRRKKELLDAIGKDSFRGVDIFEGVSPTKIAPEPTATTQGSPLSGLDPNDSGVDISGIVALGGKNWNALVKGKKV
jgi:hypothetical protein